MCHERVWVNEGVSRRSVMTGNILKVDVSRRHNILKKQVSRGRERGREEGRERGRKGGRVHPSSPASACMAPSVGSPSLTSPGTGPAHDASMPYKAGSKNVAVTILPDHE